VAREQANGTNAELTSASKGCQGNQRDHRGMQCHRREKGRRVKHRSATTLHRRFGSPQAPCPSPFPTSPTRDLDPGPGYPTLSSPQVVPHRKLAVLKLLTGLLVPSRMSISPPTGLQTAPAGAGTKTGQIKLSSSSSGSNNSRHCGARTSPAERVVLGGRGWLKF
jgi:hypothetical protein